MSAYVNAANEFARRRSLPYVEVERDIGTRYYTIRLKIAGVLIGERTELIKRGKVVSESYTLPEIKS